LPNAASNPDPQPASRRWTIVAAGFLLLALALVVIYTSRAAFFSPLALVVVAAIGLAALMLQLRLRRDAVSGQRPESNNFLIDGSDNASSIDKDSGASVRAPLWLNVLGLLFALAAVFADVLHLSVSVMQVAALGAVACFAVSGAVVLHALRKKK
jgi:hypothetical protein